MAKMFVRSTQAKWDALRDKSSYANSIVFITDKNQIILNGVTYGLSPELAKEISDLRGDFDVLKYFSKVSDGSNAASAASKDSTLTIKGSNGVSATVNASGVTVSHTNSITAGTAQGDANKLLTFGGTFTIPTVTYDAQGHITGKGSTTMTMPINPNTDTKVTSAANHYTPASDTTATISADSAKFISSIERDTKGHVTGIGTTSLPTLSDLNGVADTRKVSAGEGLSGGGALSSDVTISHGTKPTSGTANNAGTNKVVTGVSLDTYGHVASVTGTSLTADYIPNLATNKINACTGYTKGSDAEITSTDTLNTALGKVLGLISALKLKTGSLTGALIFKGVKTSKPTVTDYNVGDVIIVDNIEYVLIENEGTKTWEEFGDLSLLGQVSAKVAVLENKPGLDKVGTVTSVNGTAASGSNLTVTGGAITSSGTLTVGVATGYLIPSSTLISNWNSLTTFPGYASTAPKANGTAAVGISTKVAREDHVHPLQTTVSGNAGSATKLLTVRTISIAGDGTGSADFDGSANVTINLSLEWEEL